MDNYEKIIRAIDFIEDNLAEEITLEQIAQKSFFSPYHFHRIFTALTGISVGDYVRRRRLTEAALELINTKTRIIEISVGWGFESQATFSRAFKKQFGITPAQYRNANKNMYLFAKRPLSLESLNHLKGGITMEPKIVTKEGFKVIGMECKTTLRDNKIPELWKRFLPRVAEIKNNLHSCVYYGLSIMYNKLHETGEFDNDSEFTSIASVEVDSFDNIPDGMISREVPTQKYAVFTHKGCLSTLRETYDYIYGTWAVKSGIEIDDADEFEYYDERFDPSGSPESEVDIYIPIK